MWTFQPCRICWSTNVCHWGCPLLGFPQLSFIYVWLDDVGALNVVLSCAVENFWTKSLPLERSHAWNSPCLWFVLPLLYKLDIFGLISAGGMFWDLPVLLQNCCTLTVLPTNQTIAPAIKTVMKPHSTVEYPNNCGKGSRATVQYSYTTKMDQKIRSKILTTMKKHSSAHCTCVQGEIFLLSQMHLKEWSINNNNL